MLDSGIVDVLMITHNRPHYARRAIPRLLDTCDEQTRVWLWHNGDDPETLQVAREHAHHPRVYRFHHSDANVRLREPTNWLWRESDGAYLAKVDDDCLVPDGWIGKFRRAHALCGRLGIIACWHFQESDFNKGMASAKMRAIGGPHSLLMNAWVGGSGYLMKRECVRDAGLLKRNETFTGYCMRLFSSGWLIGWHYPLVLQEHLDDPRSPNSLLRSDAELNRFQPLSAFGSGASTIEQWDAQLRRSAEIIQSASICPGHYSKWRRLVRRIRRKLMPGRAAI